MLSQTFSWCIQALAHATGGFRLWFGIRYLHRSGSLGHCGRVPFGRAADDSAAALAVYVGDVFVGYAERLLHGMDLPQIPGGTRFCGKPFRNPKFGHKLSCVDNVKPNPSCLCWDEIWSGRDANDLLQSLPYHDLRWLSHQLQRGENDSNFTGKTVYPVYIIVEGLWQFAERTSTKLDIKHDKTDMLCACPPQNCWWFESSQSEEVNWIVHFGFSYLFIMFQPFQHAPGTIALLVALLELLSLPNALGAHWTGGFWSAIEAANDHFEMLGIVTWQ